jgi:trimethylamine--corrinoid protein Co-methyltransferase
VDEQAAHEATITLLLPAMASKGQNIYGLGMLETGMAVSLEQYVIDNEIGNAVKRAVKGVEVSDETLALDTIHKVGPGGHFLGQKHTFAHRDYIWMAELFNRDFYQTWEEKGRKDLFTMACERVDDLLAHHAPKPVDNDIKRALREIVQRADKELYTAY